MRFVKRFWAPLLAAGLVPLLIVLAWIQLNSIREMGERERFRLTQGLFAAASQLSAAFENEIGVLPAVFGHDWDDIEKSIRLDDWSNFRKRWEVWKSYAMDPSFVAGFDIIRIAADGAPATVRYWDGDRFSIDKTDGLAESLERAVKSLEQGRSFMVPADLKDGTEAFLLPTDWRGLFWIAIRIDRKALTERLIPILAERYLFGKTDYFFRIIDEKDHSTAYISDPDADSKFKGPTDVSIPLIRSDFRMVRTAVGPSPDKPVDDEPGISILKMRRQILDQQEDPDLKSELHLMLPPKPQDDRQARWTLEAIHKKGSLAAAVKAEMVRSASISLSILMILAIVLFIFATAVRRTQELADRRQEFIGTVTHELKTPIAVIKAAADNLADGVVKDLTKTARYGTVIKRESGKLADMIDSLLVYGRVGDGAPRKVETVDLGAIAQRAIEYRQDELIAGDFKIEVQIPEDAELPVKGDPSALELAIGNLITNAAKHAASGRYIRISAGKEAPKDDERKTAPEGWAVVYVQDKGPGIPRKERKLVFDPFYRGERARSRQTPGSGLGLNLVGRIVAAHGGRVDLDTQLERGSTFMIRIPLEDTRYGERN